MFTPDTIQTAAFTINKSGYDPMEVDHLLDQLAFSWETEASVARLRELASAASLSSVRRGYDCQEVDALLRELHEYCAAQAATAAETETADDEAESADADEPQAVAQVVELEAGRTLEVAHSTESEPSSDEGAVSAAEDATEVHAEPAPIETPAADELEELFGLETAERPDEVELAVESAPVEPAATAEAIGAVPSLEAPVPDLAGLADAIARTMRTMGGLQSFVENEVAAVKVSCERQVDETQLACDRMLEEARDVASDYIARAEAHADAVRAQATAEVADLRRQAAEEIEAQRRTSDESIARRQSDAEERWTERTAEVEATCAEKLESAQVEAERRIAEAEAEAEAIRARAEARERSAREVVDNAANLQATILASIEHARAALLPDASGH
jgi:DivIVA domain-containing protein